MTDARLVLKKFGYNMKSRERDRRPTLDELDKVLKHFFEMLQRRPSVIHMPKVMEFAIFSTRRMDEIARIRWEDLDEHRQAVKVRGMKKTGQKTGNDVWCCLPDEAWIIVESMPRECPEIFPYNTDSIGTAWSKACKITGIEDLHFHDLRHEVGSAGCLKWTGHTKGLKRIWASRLELVAKVHPFAWAWG